MNATTKDLSPKVDEVILFLSNWLLGNLSEVTSNNYVYVFCEVKPELDKLLFQRGRPSLVFAYLPNFFRKFLSIARLRPLQIQVTKNDEDGYVMMRPYLQLSLTSSYTYWSLLFSAYIKAEPKLGMKPSSSEKEVPIYVQITKKKKTYNPCWKQEPMSVSTT